jgi:hypothetical protein
LRRRSYARRPAVHSEGRRSGYNAAVFQFAILDWCVFTVCLVGLGLLLAWRPASAGRSADAPEIRDPVTAFATDMAAPGQPEDPNPYQPPGTPG